MKSMQSDKTPERKERLEARITRAQKALFKQAADLQGRSLSDFVVQAASDLASRVIQEQQIVTLTAREQKVFIEALLNPPAPGPRLRAAARRYNKAMGDK